MKKRSLGITVCGAGFVIGAASILAYELSSLFVIPYRTKEAQVVMSLTGFLLLITGIGLLKRQKWALWLTRIEAMLGLLVGAALLLGYKIGGQPSGGFLRTYAQFEFGPLLCIFLGASTLLYFFRPSVKAQFVKAADSSEHTAHRG